MRTHLAETGETVTSLTIARSLAREEIVTENNIDDLRAALSATDLRSEIQIGRRVTIYALHYSGSQRGDALILHNEGRAAVSLGSDSDWGDYNPSDGSIDADDGTIYDFQG